MSETQKPVHSDTRDTASANEPDAVDVASPGQLIRQARQQQDMSRQALAAATNLTPDVVTALENDAFDELSQPVYVRGYYRQCAKVLGLSEQQVMSAYKSSGAVAGPCLPVSGDFDVIPEDVTPGSARSLRPIGMIILLIIIAGALWLFWPILASYLPESPGDNVTANPDTHAQQTVRIISNDNGTQQATPADSADAPADVPGSASGSAAPDQPESADRHAAAQNSADAMNEAAVPAQTSRQVSHAPAQPTGQAADNTVDGQDARDADTQDKASAPVAAPGTLRLVFHGKSWTSIRDATGKQVLRGLVEPGETRTIDGKPPYKMVLGNARDVDVYMGGQQVDIADKINSNSVARLTLSATAD